MSPTIVSVASLGQALRMVPKLSANCSFCGTSNQALDAWRYHRVDRTTAPFLTQPLSPTTKSKSAAIRQRVHWMNKINASTACSVQIKNGVLDLWRTPVSRLTARSGVPPQDPFKNPILTNHRPCKADAHLAFLPGRPLPLAGEIASSRKSVTSLQPELRFLPLSHQP